MNAPALGRVLATALVVSCATTAPSMASGCGKWYRDGEASNRRTARTAKLTYWTGVSHDLVSTYAFLTERRGVEANPLVVAVAGDNRHATRVVAAGLALSVLLDRLLSLGARRGWITTRTANRTRIVLGVVHHGFAIHNWRLGR